MAKDWKRFAYQASEKIVIMTLQKGKIKKN